MARFSEQKENLQMIGFYAGEKLFGTDILSVQEILRDPDIEPVRQLPNFIQGVVNLRGQRVPVIDLRVRLDPGAAPRDGVLWLLVVALGKNVVGYLVNSVTRIMKIPPESILPAPELMLAGLRSQYILGVCNTELGLLIVTHLVRMLDTSEIEALQKLESV